MFHVKQIPHEGILRKERQPMSEKKACPCCSEKHTARSEEEKKKLINRLKRIEGQIRGIIGMMENDAYCNDILIQSAESMQQLIHLIKNCLPPTFEPVLQEISAKAKMRPLMSLWQPSRS